MKITMDIPEEFEKHFNEDRFEDSLKRIITDVTDEIESDFSISGRYEIELCEMLIKAFENAEPVKHGRWLHNDMILNRQKCSECGFYSDDLQSDNYCPNCGARME